MKHQLPPPPGGFTTRVRRASRRAKAAAPFSKNCFCHSWNWLGRKPNSSQRSEAGRFSRRWSRRTCSFWSAVKFGRRVRGMLGLASGDYISVKPVFHFRLKQDSLT